MKVITSRHHFNFALTSLVLAFFPLAHSETLVASDVHTRLALAIRVPNVPLQKRLPAGWQIDEADTGPSKGANLIVSFVDRLLNLDAAGKPVAGGRDRYVVLAVPVKQSTGTQAGNMVIRAYTGNAKILPGAYKTSVLAQVRHEHSDQGVDVEAGVATDSWEVRDGLGGFIQAHIRYRRGAVSRATVEQKMFSPSQPDFFRVYRIDQGTEIIRSANLDVDHADSFELEINIEELTELFDGTHEVLAISAMPWGARQIFLP